MLSTINLFVLLTIASNVNGFKTAAACTISTIDVAANILGRSQDVCKGARFPVEGKWCVVTS